MSTPFACAWDAALVSGLTLNPITIAFDAEASMTSLSLIAPTELWMTFSLTSSVDSRSSASASASTEPCTSALRMSRSSFTSPDWICFWSPSSVIRVAVLAHRRDLPGLALVGHRHEDIARRGNAAEPLDLDRVGRASALDLLAARVDQRADSARVCADDDRVSLLQGAVLDQHGRDGASPAVQPALDDHAPGCTVRVGFELQDLGLERGHLEELVDARPLLRRRRDVDRLAPPLLRDEAMVGQLTLDALGIGLGLVDLVHDDEDRHVRRSRVVDRLDGLRHDAVVGGHHEDDDVGRLGAAGAHRRERLVPWRVQERNLAVPSLDLVGADVLRDSPKLLLGDLGLADRVEERGLPVVDVTHDGDDGRAQLELSGVEVLLVEDFTFDGSDLEIDIELVRDELRGRRIEQLVDGRHDAELEQRLDDLARLPSHLLGEFAHRDRLGHPDQLTLDLGRRRGRLDGRGRRRCWR